MAWLVTGKIQFLLLVPGAEAGPAGQQGSWVGLVSVEFC